MKIDSARVIEWGVAARSFAQRVECGDQYLVEAFPNGVLVAVADGLGHGPRAAVAGKAAITALKSHAHEPVTSLVKRCHEEIRRTRGVVMSLASFNALEEKMTWLGVGNVKGVLVSATQDGDPEHKWLLSRGGVVGYRLPTLRPIVVPVSPGDTLILCTDGLRSGFADDLVLDDRPQQMADRILLQHSRSTDDAMVLVARYMGFSDESQGSRFSEL